MYIIRKDFEFSASHQLLQLEDKHPCKRMHGHNYKVTVELRSWGLQDTGFVYDYRDLDKFKNFIDNVYDHQHLNDLMMVPTAENIARTLFDHFKGTIPFLFAIEVSETPKTNARYESNSK
jgi:6-pyruvoyltetrahydropterin/6-carboxytetrahydropterin synthase